MPSVATNGKPKTGLAQKMSKDPPRQGPLWRGPEVDGVTFSLLSRFLTCRERFRVHVISGLRATDSFNHRMEYGNMWHACEEALANELDPIKAVTEYATKLLDRYPMSREDIDKWYRVCKIQFPLYIKYWAKHQHVKDRTPIFAERVFNVPLTLPSGRVVRLRGKFDSVDLIGKGKEAGIWLQENKTKGDVDEVGLRRALKFDLQTLLYLVALEELGIEEIDRMSGGVIPNGNAPCLSGVRYNVVRRPLSGGKGTIRRHQATKNKPEETLDSFYGRLAEYIIEAPQEYFMRWQVEVSAADVQRFREKCLDPLLENLCWWYDEVTGAELTNKIHDYGFPPTHWQHPYGVRNVLDEGGFADVDEHLVTGSMVGLRQVEELFPELG